MNKYFFIPVNCLLFLLVMTAHADLSLGGKMFITDIGGVRLQGIETTGPLSGLRFGSAASVSAGGDLIRTNSYYNQGSWLDNPANLSGGLVFRRNGIAHMHVSTGGTVRVRQVIGYDVAIDIDVDTDRDNDVDGDDELMEDTWSKGTGSRGAIVLPNCDDDGGHGYPDNWTGGDWDFMMGDEPANTTVDNAADVNDLAPLHIAKVGLATLPDDLRITLTVSQPAGESTYFTPTAAENRLRIFLPGNGSYIQAGDAAIIGPENGAQAKFVKTPVNPDEFSYALFAGNGVIQFGVEGIELGAQIAIELTMENAQGIIGSDEVRIRVAPFALWDHTCAVNTAAGSGKTAYVENLDVLNEELRDFLRAEFGTAHLDEANTGDWWLQDGCEIGYAKAPYGLLPVVLSLPRGSLDCTDLNDPSTCQNFLYMYTHNELLKENVGVCTRVEVALTNSQDAGGNIECIPRDNGNKPGYFFFGDCMQPAISDFFIAQDVNPPIPVTTDWLSVGHVDEIVSFAPDGQRVFVADPDVAWGLLVWASKIDPDARIGINRTIKVGDYVNSAWWRYSNFDLVMNSAHLPYIRNTVLGLPSPESTPVAGAGNSGTGNLSSGGAFIGFFPNNLKRYYSITFTSDIGYNVEYREEDGSWMSDGNGTITEDCVFENALCFLLKHWWSGTPNTGDIFTFDANPLCTTLETPVSYGMDDFLAVAFTNNSVNCLVKNANTVFTAKIYGPEVDYRGTSTVTDILGDYRDAMFSKVYSQIYIPNDWQYHNWGGSIHCATNVQRVTPSYNWWDY